MLGEPEVLATLQRDFVNVWLLAKDLDGIAARSGDPDVATLCARIREHYDYPVDSVVITPDLRVVGHVNAHAERARSPEGYLGFLREALARARGEEPPALPAVRQEAERTAAARERAPVVLTRAKPSDSVLDTIRHGGFADPAVFFVAIDVTAFRDGGVIEVAVRVGTGTAAGQFELCAAPPGQPQAMRPVESLPSLEPGTEGTLRHRFEAGATLGLVAMPAGGAIEGEGNAFLATITVRPD